MTTASDSARSAQDVIRDELSRAYDGDPWHGSSVVKILEGLSAADAHVHPIPGAHSIWELVLHMTAWTGEVRRRLEGGKPGEPPEGDWPAPPRAPDDREWSDAASRLRTAHHALLETLDRTPAAQLPRVVDTEKRDPAQGTGVTHEIMLHGLAQHHAYHSGQVAILKRALGR
jgi:uncharacterized damage-inducible protein DinB